MKKMLLVVNPTAGMRKAARLLPEITAIFNRADYDVHTYITAAQSDAECVVCARAAEMDLVVCCGGDGTFNETVSGLLRSGADVPLGYIPAGTTNDFASSLRLPLDPLKAAREIIDGAPQPYDVGMLGSRYFAYVASFGAFTKASYTTPQSVKNALGHTAYVLEGIQELSQIRNVAVRMELDGEEIAGNYLFGAICNSTSVGGILTLDPKQVDMADGQFEVLLVRAPKDFNEIRECIQALSTQKYNCGMITFRSARHVTVHASPDMPWTLDGEWEAGHSTVEVTNLHHAIRLIKKGDTL